MRQNKSEAGNAFLFVLLAVVLFAALAFTFSRGGQQGIGNISKQEAKVAAQELIGFFNLVNKAYNNLRAKGCSVDDISFANSADTGAFVASNDSATAPGDNSCHIFDTNGGKVSFNMDWTEYQIPFDDIPVPTQDQHGNIFFKQTGATNVGVGTATPEIMVHFNYVQSAICLAYNDLLNLDIDTSVDDAGPIIGDENTDYVGHESFCRYTDGTAHGQIRQVWLAR